MNAPMLKNRPWKKSLDGKNVEKEPSNSNKLKNRYAFLSAHPKFSIGIQKIVFFFNFSMPTKQERN
jgi:hypothetical protein